MHSIMEIQSRSSLLGLQKYIGDPQSLNDGLRERELAPSVRKSWNLSLRESGVRLHLYSGSSKENC